MTLGFAKGIPPQEVKAVIDECAAYLAHFDKKSWRDMPGSAFWPFSASRNKYREMAEYVYRDRPHLFERDLRGLRQLGHMWTEWQA